MNTEDETGPPPSTTTQENDQIVVPAVPGSVPPGAGSWQWVSGSTPDLTGWLKLS